MADCFADRGADMHGGVTEYIGEAMAEGQERSRNLAKPAARTFPFYGQEEECWTRASSGFKRAKRKEAGLASKG